jgi:hypothetical protein
MSDSMYVGRDKGINSGPVIDVWTDKFQIEGLITTFLTLERKNQTHFR